MDIEKVKIVAARLFNYEIQPFLMAVASGLVSPLVDSDEWNDLKKKVIDSKFSDSDVRRMVELSDYEKLAILFEILDD